MTEKEKVYAEFDKWTAQAEAPHADVEEKIDRTPHDKSTWPRGPWDAEPDRVEGEHAGLPTLALRAPLGVWCGYVAVPPGHPAHGANYNNVKVDVHGGLTYGGLCDGERICHIPKPGEPGDVFWFGFDCGHYRDFVPSMAAYRSTFAEKGTTYKDLEYVQKEITQLAEQLAVLGPDGVSSEED